MRKVGDNGMQAKEGSEVYGLCEVEGQEIKLPILMCSTKDFVLYLIVNEESLY